MYKKVVKHVGRKRPSSAGCEKRKKMTTEEFIEAVNAIDNKNEMDVVISPLGIVFLRNCLYVVATLGEHDTKWCFTTNCNDVTIPTKILKLMVELAESRAEDNKCVILNGKQFLFERNISTRAFLIIDNSLSSRIISIDDLVNVSYTKEELEQLKSTLPKKLQEAVDLLTVTVGEAKKVLKHDN